MVAFERSAEMWVAMTMAVNREVLRAEAGGTRARSVREIVCPGQFQESERVRESAEMACVEASVRC